MSGTRCIKSACYSPYACKGWGYCRQRNIDAGGMQNVTTEMQQQWRREDAGSADVGVKEVV